MRRQTLGAVSTNARPDRNAGRVRHSIAARPSHATGAGRRSSVYGKGTSLSQDPRQVRSKQFKERSTQLLIEYLVEHGFDATLSPAILNCPSTKLFQDIVKFLIHQIDPTFEIDRFDESVILFFTKLGYPFKISKGAIRSACTPHQWPVVLAALVWLVEVLMFDESYSQQNAGDGIIDGVEEKSEQQILENLSVSYSSWLSGQMDDDACDAQLLELWSSSCEQMEEELETFRQANNKLLNEIAEEKKCETLESLVEKRAGFERDVPKFQRFMAQFEQRVNVTREQVATQQEFVQTKETDIQKLRDRVAELQYILEHQTISPDDVKAMRRMRAVLEENIDELQLKKEELRRNISLDDNQIRKIVAEIEQRSLRINEYLERLHVLPNQEMHERCPVNIIQINSTLMNPSQADLNAVRRSNWFCDQDLIAVTGKLKRYRDSLETQAVQQTLELRDERSKFESRENEIEETQQQIEHYKDRSARVEQESRRVRQTLLEIQNKMSAQVEDIELEIQNIENGNFEGEEKRLKQNLAALQAERENSEREAAKLKSHVNEKLFQVLRRAAKYRVFVRSKLHETCELLDGMVEEVRFAMAEIADCSNDTIQDTTLVTAMSDE